MNFRSNHTASSSSSIQNPHENRLPAPGKTVEETNPNNDQSKEATGAETRNETQQINLIMGSIFLIPMCQMRRARRIWHPEREVPPVSAYSHKEGGKICWFEPHWWHHRAQPLGLGDADADACKQISWGVARLMWQAVFFVYSTSGGERCLGACRWLEGVFGD